MSLLKLRGLSVLRNGRPVLKGIDLEIGPGEFVGLLGPNGAGKTTLLRAALGLQPAEGFSSLADLSPAARARAAAFMPQAREIAWPMSVERVAALGRLARPEAAAEADRAAVERALAALNLGDLRGRRADELSGGEQARVLMARLLAQETPLLIADEPAAGLDPAAQISAMRVFAGRAAEGAAVLASLHDLGLAARHCTRLILLREGRILADGPPDQALTPGNLARVFGVTAWSARTDQGFVLQPLDVI
ncbi:ABC transporter ATP-binding protein [Neomegalonema sp.]|uniref:ABC transporter ATP-binding protein n=1 Tax=Neomegalonema sp. TaxID=2039713 RepID=UPI00260DB800|nr:ABC transporter ATP-binding protein [Neomegalonema sp.]MDD2867752.1 ABC transporter ATP-binding protein [Neomegalonema sp.]